VLGDDPGRSEPRLVGVVALREGAEMPLAADQRKGDGLDQALLRRHARSIATRTEREQEPCPRPSTSGARAKLLLDRWGDGAEAEAKRHRDHCRRTGEAQGVAVWTQVLAAIAELRDTEASGQRH
jgi:hypothetical protein